MTTQNRLTQAVSGPFGLTNVIPRLLSSFSDYVNTQFSYGFNEAVYTITPLFFLDWLNRYGLHVNTRRAFNFDALWHATLSYFIMAVKIEDERGVLDFRNELQGISVPTYMQDCHCCAPVGGRNRSYPFESRWVFCPMWRNLFIIDPRFWVNGLKTLSRYLLEQGYPLTALDFNTYHDQSSNMITHGYPDLSQNAVPVHYTKGTVANDANGQPMTVNTVTSVTVRYEDPSQLSYNWQTQYHIWWSITCDQFSPVYISMPRIFTVTAVDVAPLIAGLVGWYLTTRGGGTPMPNFGGSGGPGGNQPSGGGNNPNPPGSGPPNPGGPNRNGPNDSNKSSKKRSPKKPNPSSNNTTSTTVQVTQPEQLQGNNIVPAGQLKRGLTTSIIVDSQPNVVLPSYNNNNVIDYSQ